ncbi:protein of unknown function DUF1501 [Planctopirus limnophila DSM 3776]|uniref:DUF1501 domain-containing protein n=1 Tax=Planctopirus limnophila (strain ATCC 43296 / DSM 3776 / IFAM 1008 / Mu 290) TaxID=521674 RepID=D5SYY4_PLAL2|nr:DUF1501 domain-containing protein [Planctopirus limnophila]ADG67916.1 protein of unknown function DUF1501 [Planctopirus limnophila DSM 3776]
MNPFLNRRDFNQYTALGGAAALSAGLPFGLSAGIQGVGSASSLLAEEHAKVSFPMGKAEHCVMIWLGGGAGQIDTWDPKVKGDPKANKAGSYYGKIQTAIPGVEVCEHLSRCAPIMDRFTLFRTVHHDVIDEHAAATNRMHTGRPVSETVIYPSVGSVIAHQRGAAGDGVPAYVLIGYPSTTRGPGFLGSKGNYVYLTDTESGPQGFQPASVIRQERQARRNELLKKVRQLNTTEEKQALLKNYESMIDEAQRLAGPQFMRIFDLKSESADLRNEYGGEFGQRCLLTRRLLQSGVRFVEVSHNLNFLNGTGWDVHNDGIVQQHRLIQELDQALAALVLDLERNKLLDKTLIVVSTEFGRPAKFDGGGGRGHHGKCFSVACAGGGIKTGVAIGETDDLAMNIVTRPVSVPDLHATMYAVCGVNPREELYAGERPVPITDGGTPVLELFS